ncbi:AAA family ATPase [Thermomonospora sp. CIF 1]|uniref:ATP-binding protein n=1 Tax=Thermomonospora sp. CIF 1 TaxID=1916083 RepID=UPI000B09431F|nr:AAA family ATPase [Thermomonospora sp. CIF 1]PKK14964.1 MAG: hypothetical protein BUE48_007365 [Thermomonospora sp. CIF 1]
MGRVARPGRRPSPVPDPDSPLGRFAQGLRELRDQAGDPSYEALARETEQLGSPYSATSLRNAASGRTRPSWDVTEMFVRACVAFARKHPRRADSAAGEWKTDDLLAIWTARWQAISLSGEPAAAQPGARSPDRFAAGAPGRLPATLTRFVGREAELATGLRLLSESRLVTLTGIGGVGKTRLALHLAEAVAVRFPGGVHLVELAELTEPTMVDRAVATALGVQTEAERTPLEAMAEALRGRRTLLVLDNCEHLLEATAALTRALLHAVPQLRVLATSRQPLNEAGEQVLAVDPLPLPHRDGSAEQCCSAAVELFVDRAKAAVPDFRLTDANREAVVRVCRMLEGLPLALELAARRLRLLTVQELAERLDQRFALLGAAGADRTAPPRHRTLRAVFDWSHELCSAEERAAWERLSVCAGTVSLADAEALCADQRPAAQPALEAIAGLVDKSLLTRIEVRGRTRLRMLETVRMYGREHLAASGRDEQARRRHLEHYLGLARRAEDEYASPRQCRRLLRLREEHANLRQAFRYALADEQPSPLLFEGARALWLYWIACGNVGEGVHWMRRLSERFPEPPRPDLTTAWCWAMWAAAFALLLQGDHGGCAAFLDRVESAASRAGDGGAEWAGLQAAVHQQRGLSALFRGDTERAERHSHEALRFGGHRPGLLTTQQALAQIGLSAAVRGAGEEAVHFIRRAIELSEECGETWHRSYLLWTLAIAYTEEGRAREAVPLLRQSLDFKMQLGDLLGMATVSETLAWVLAQSGDPHTAALLLGAAHTTWRPAGAPQLWGFSHLVRYRDRGVQQIRRMLGEASFEKSYRAGERLGLDQALSQALGKRFPG